MRRLSFFLALSLLVASLCFVLAAETELNVPNVPPRLITDIPNQSLVADVSNQSGFDLDDYITDDNGDNITFTYTSLTNITIYIDSNNEVSFSPDVGYVGTQTMQFFADDSASNMSSNIFYVIVGEDTTPPQWSNPSKNRATVYQNFNVQFSTIWTDNVALESYIFSIDQGTGFSNKTLVLFSGTSNQSLQTFQISASAGTTVRWLFYAIDTSGNVNATAIQEFTVATPATISGSPGSGAGSGGSSRTGTSKTVGAAPAGEGSEGGSVKGFVADTENFKITLRQGDSITKLIRITSTGTINQTIDSWLNDLGSLANIDLDSFYLLPGDSKDLLIEFNIPKRTAVGEYFGSLNLFNGLNRATIPIVIDVKKFDAEVELEVNVSEEYKRLKAGKVIKAKITIEALKDIRTSDAELVYSIKDFYGNILDSNTEKIEFTSTFEEEKELTVPEGTEDGEYLFYARIVSEDWQDLDSDTFFVGSRFKLKSLVFPLIYLLILLLVIMLFIIYRRNKRKRELLELYLLINELKYFVKKGDTDEALEIYKRIKVIYGQRIPKDFNQDKIKLKEELEKFSKVLRAQKVAAKNPKKIITKGTPATPKPLPGNSPKQKPSETIPEEKVLQTKPPIIDGTIKTPLPKLDAVKQESKQIPSLVVQKPKTKNQVIPKIVPVVNTKNVVPKEKINSINAKKEMAMKPGSQTNPKPLPSPQTMAKAPTTIQETNLETINTDKEIQKGSEKPSLNKEPAKE